MGVYQPVFSLVLQDLVNTFFGRNLEGLVGWWHSIGGDPSKVVEKLERASVPITRVKVKSSSKEWVLHFGRTRPEERGLGWYDPKIQLDGGAVDVEALLVEAQDATSHGSVTWVPSDFIPRQIYFTSCAGAMP